MASDRIEGNCLPHALRPQRHWTDLSNRQNRFGQREYNPSRILSGMSPHRFAMPGETARSFPLAIDVPMRHSGQYPQWQRGIHRVTKDRINHAASRE